MTHHHSLPSPRITCVILAGGAGRRMGGEDKGLMQVDDTRLIEFVISRLLPQCESILINCNRNHAAYEHFGFPVIEDTIPGAGPLAGLLSALETTSETDVEYILSVPCDTPLLPLDLVARMYATLQEQGTEVCTVDDGERLHPVIMLVRRTVTAPLRSYLEGGGRKVHDWFYARSHSLADFSDTPEAFANINTPQQLQVLREQLRQGKA